MIKEKEESSSTTIRDPKMEPYFISKDSHCYTVYKNVTPDPKYATENVPSKDYSKVIGYFKNFGSCLQEVCTQKVNDKKDYSSVKEYLDTFKQIQNNINELINIGI